MPQRPLQEDVHVQRLRRTWRGMNICVALLVGMLGHVIFAVTDTGSGTGPLVPPAGGYATVITLIFLAILLAPALGSKVLAPQRLAALRLRSSVTADTTPMEEASLRVRTGLATLCSYLTAPAILAVGLAALNADNAYLVLAVANGLVLALVYTPDMGRILEGTRQALPRSGPSGRK